VSPLLDPDVLTKTIQADALNPSPISAGRDVLRRVEHHLKNHESFALETTRSGKHYIRTMREARNLGFIVRLVYIGTSDVEINLSRIQRRVIGGGHSVPEIDVRRRYKRSVQNLPIAAHLSDFVIVFDNSTRHGYQEVVTIEDGQCRWADSIPSWTVPLKSSFEQK
jgi:predicted ABC-type ATPase